MAQRKTLSKKTRVEVFKRDAFKCQYCGRSAPDVILEVDHIVPVAEGGKYPDWEYAFTKIGGICYNRKKQREVTPDA